MNLSKIEALSLSGILRDYCEKEMGVNLESTFEKVPEDISDALITQIENVIDDNDSAIIEFFQRIDSKLVAIMLAEDSGKEECVMKLTDKQLSGMREVLDIQGYDGNWNYDEYMFGMYNGMELMMSMLESREPNYRKRPAQFLCENPDDSEPISESDSNG